jgi:hypothetical protein
VYRNYFVPHSGDAVGQLEREVELLARTPIGRWVQHGYPRVDGKRAAELADKDWDDLTQFDVGLHENCEVTATAVGGAITLAGVPADQIVHHVYAAAFNFAGTVVANDTMRRIGGKMLAAEYQATVLAAWEMSRKYPGRPGSNRLVLTALGGGVFSNPRKLIIDAVASCEEIIRQSGLQVYFVCYDEYSYMDSVRAGLRELVTRLGGRVILSQGDL